MKALGKGIIVLVVVVVGGFLVFGNGVSLPSLGGGTGGVAPPAQITDTPSIAGTQNYNGDLNVSTEGRDSNDPAVTYSGATEYDIICYEKIGDDVTNWEVLDSGDDSATEDMIIPIRKTAGSDAGVTEMWCELSVESASPSVIVDKDGTIKANSRIDTAIYDDPNLDQNDEWVFRVDVTGVAPSDPNNIPSMNLRLKFVEDATSANLDSTTPDVANAGTGNHENRLKWDIDFVTTSSSNDSGAKALSQIQLRLNDTDDTLWDENASYIEIPNGASIQRIKLTEMDRTDLTSTTVYKFKYGNDISVANIINVEKSGDPEVDTPVVLWTNFNTTDQALCVELEFRYVDPSGSFTTTSDDVEVAEGAVGTPCTL